MTAAGQAPAQQRRLALWLVAIVAAATAVRLVLIALSPLGLVADEAQYWVWGQDLDWGYFSKPPMIAWLIRGAVEVCGEAAWCARSLSPLLHAGTSLICGLIAARLYGPAAGFWAGVAFLTLPAVSFSSALITTDVPLLLFWAAALYAVLRVFEDRSPVWTLALGVALGLGLLSKYAMAYFVVCTLLASAVYRRHRWFLTSRNLAAALAVAGLIVAPNIIWNLANGWATVAHVGQNASLDRELLNPGSLARFFGAQFGVFGPLLFALLLWRGAAALRARPDDREGLLLCYALPILLLVTVQALLSRAHANWAAPAYVAATVAVVGWSLTAGRLWLATASVALHLGLAAVLAVYVLDVPIPAFSGDSDPRRRLRGWPETAAQLNAIMRADPQRTLLANDRKIMASLLYYLRDEAWRPLIWDYGGPPRNHYELTARYDPAPGESALLVSRGPNPTSILKAFATVEDRGRIRVAIGSGRPRTLYLYALDDHVGD